MKSQATLLLIVLALGLSHCSTANWAGVWNISERYVSECGPMYEITISQIGTNLEFEWTNSHECEYAHFNIKASAPVPEGNTVNLKAEIFQRTQFNGRLLLQGDKLILINQRGVYATYNRTSVNDPARFVGDWMIDKKEVNALKCYPRDSIVVTNAGSALTFSWTWESSEGCKALELDGKEFINSVPIPERTNSFYLYYYVNGTRQSASFSAYQENGAFHSYFNNAYCTISRKSDSRFAKFLKWIFA